MPTVTPFLMFTSGLGDALRLYASVFKDAEIPAAIRDGDNPQSAAFSLGGQSFSAYEGGEHFAFSEAISLYVDCADQAEVDYYWDALTANGGSESQCGWLKDRFGLSWQIVPKALGETLGGSDPEGSARALQAMLGMKKLDVAALERAYAGN